MFVISETYKNCQHICNLFMFCFAGKAGWAAWSVDFGHNFYYPFTYTFAIIILSKYHTKTKVKSRGQKIELDSICEEEQTSLDNTFSI